MSSYAPFFLNSPSSVVHLETLEISHPSFSQTYWIVRNAVNGITAMLEDGVTNQEFVYYPLHIDVSGASDDLDQTITVNLGDLGEIIPAEIDSYTTWAAAQIAAGSVPSKPAVVYRVYRSDDMSGPIEGPFIYEARTNAMKREGSLFTAGAPRLNLNQTGESYRMNRFPMLRGFL